MTERWYMVVNKDRRYHQASCFDERPYAEMALQAIEDHGGNGSEYEIVEMIPRGSKDIDE